MSLFDHTPHPHTPQNPNDTHKAEQAGASFNERLAVSLTRVVGTMTCAYFFACLALLGFPALSAWLGPSVAIYVTWISQCFIQLVMLSVIMVGQRVQSRGQEIQANEAYNVALKNAHDIAQIAEHLAVQDKELIEQTQILKEIKEQR